MSEHAPVSLLWGIPSGPPWVLWLSMGCSGGEVVGRSGRGLRQLFHWWSFLTTTRLLPISHRIPYSPIHVSTTSPAPMDVPFRWSIPGGVVIVDDFLDDFVGDLVGEFCADFLANFLVDLAIPFWLEGRAVLLLSVFLLHHHHLHLHLGRRVEPVFQDGEGDRQLGDIVGYHDDNAGVVERSYESVHSQGQIADGEGHGAGCRYQARGCMGAGLRWG